MYGKRVRRLPRFLFWLVTPCDKDVVKNVVNKSNIFGHILTGIYQFLYVLYVFALFAFHVHVAGGTLST